MILINAANNLINKILYLLFYLLANMVMPDTRNGTPSAMASWNLYL